MFTLSFKTIEDKVAVIQPIESRKRAKIMHFHFRNCHVIWCFNLTFMVLIRKIIASQRKECSFVKNELLKNNFKTKPSVRKELIQHTTVVCFHTTGECTHMFSLLRATYNVYKSI
eukprot:sb/3476744/